MADRRPPTSACRSFFWLASPGSAEERGKRNGGKEERPVLVEEPALDTQLNVIKLIGPADNQANYRYQSTIERYLLPCHGYTHGAFLLG